MKFKRQLSVLLAAIMVIGSTNIALADNEISMPEAQTDSAVIPMEESDIVTYPVEGGNIYFDKTIWAIIDADEGITSAEIPEIIGNKKVVYIWTDAFKGCSSLTKVVIPETVTSIGESAFKGCTLLKNITIPENVTHIEENSFEDCSFKTAGPMGGGYDLEFGCTELPGGSAIGGCKSITSIDIPEGATYIGTYAFGIDNYCSLINISIPSTVTYIADYAFDNCSLLTNITVSEENSEFADIDGVLFNKGRSEIKCYPRGRTNKQYTIPDSVTSIGDFAFDDCASLTSINIPGRVTSIGSHAFGGCKSLTSIEIPEGVTEIKEYTFSDCTSLASVTIPASVTWVDMGAFDNCYALNDVYFGGDKALWKSMNKSAGGEYLENAIIHYNAISSTESTTKSAEVSTETSTEGTTAEITTEGTTVETTTEETTTIETTTEETTTVETTMEGTTEEPSTETTSKTEEPSTETSSKTEEPSTETSSKTEEPSTETSSITEEPSTETSSITEEPSTETTTAADESSTATAETSTESTTTATESTTEPTTTEPDYVISGSSIVVPVEGGNVYIDKDSGEVADCDEGVVSANIPSKVNGIEVKSISATAFAGCKDLKSITIPDTVTAIAENAFADCVSLTEIHCTKGSFADNKEFYPENTEIKYEEKPAYLYGDADGDGKLIASDAAAVLQKVLKSTYKLPIEDLTPDYEKYLDVDGSGKLDAADAAMILQKVLKSTYKFSIEK